MRIALVCPFDFSRYGGVQNQVRQLAEFVRSQGHAVDIYAPTSRRATDVEGLRHVGKAVPITIPGSGTVARINILPWIIARGWHRGYNDMRHAFASGAYDIIHVHAPEMPMLGMAALKFAQKAPPETKVVATFHSSHTGGLPTMVYSAMAKPFSDMFGLENVVDLRIAVSTVAMQSIQKFCPGEYRIIPNGVDTERFSPNVPPIDKYGDGSINVLFVGRLGNNERRKGLEYAVAGFEKIRPLHPTARLIIVGAGNPDRATQGLLNAVGNPNIILEGPASTDDLPKYIRRAHIGIAPATHGESFGLVPAEFMSSGIAVLATNIPGYDNVVGDAGLLVTPRSPEAIAQALDTLIRNEPLRRQLGGAGRQRIVENFELRKVYSQVLSAYEEVRAPHRELVAAGH